MGLPAFARPGVSRHRRLLIGCCHAALLGFLAACGGGSGDGPANGPPADPVSATGTAQVGELPESLALGEVRTFNFTDRLSLAWAGDGAFTGSIVAQIESGGTFAPGPFFTLQHNGPPAPPTAEGGGPHEFRYANGFFLLTALQDNDVTQGLAFAVDLYPTGVTRVPPTSACEPSFPAPCYNGLGLIGFQDWPKRAGDSVNLLIRREDPAGLPYTILIKPSDREEFHSAAVLPGELSATIERGAAWKLDFPTARAKVRGCDVDGQCIDSNEQPLQGALTKGVLPVQPLPIGPNAHVAISASGNWLATKSRFFFDGPAVVQLYVRQEEGRWRGGGIVQSDVPGFGRTFALSGDGNTLAVEASTCAVATTVCDNGTVIVFHKELSQWSEQARIAGMRAPRLSHDGDRLVGIGIQAMRGNVVVALVRNGTAWTERPFPPLDYAPLDIEVSADGFTLAVARQGTLQNPCGCRAVVIYDCSDPLGWHEGAVLHSSKRPDPAGSPDDDGFGFAKPGSHSLAVSGDGNVVAVGASLDGSDAGDAVGDPANRGALESGAVYVFARGSDGTWLKQAFLKARAATAADHFGHQVALSRDARLLFGGARGLAADAPGINRNHAVDQGLPTPTPGMNGALTGAAAYVFERAESAAWTQRAAAVTPNASRVDFDAFFGLAVSADASTVLLSTGEPGTGGDPQALVRTVFVY